MKIWDRFDEKGITLFLEGSFDETSSLLVEDRIGKIIALEDVDNISLDLSSVDYISSAGIRVLIVAHKNAIKCGKKVTIGKMSNKSREILEMVGILPLFAGKGTDR